MSNHLARYTRIHPDVGCGFDHEDGRRAIRMMGTGWVAWHAPERVVMAHAGPRLFASAARAAQYLEEHHDNG